MELNEAVKVFSSLAQPARLRVFRLLVKAGQEGCRAGDLSSELSIPKNTLSFHLKELTNAGLVSAERNGRSIIYRLHEEAIRQFLHFLTEDCCEGRPELCLPDACSEQPCSEELHSEELHSEELHSEESCLSRQDWKNRPGTPRPAPG